MSGKKHVFILVLVVAALIIAVLNPLIMPTGLTVLNESNESNASNLAPVWNSELTFFTIQSGSSLVLDLNDYFLDPDNDSLVFSATQPSNFVVAVTDNILSITPDAGFIGTRSMSIIASDDQDFADQTIMVDVIESNESVESNEAQVITDDDKFYGKKLTDEPLFETRFTSIEQDGSQLTLIFYHDSAEPQRIWIEGDVDYTLSDNISEAYDNVTLVIALVNGIVPRFKLHVGETSEIFEFGKEIPEVVTDGNYSLIDRDDELLDVQITKEEATVVIKGTNSSLIKADVGEIIDPKIKTDVFAADAVDMEEAVLSLPASGDVN
ncbi:hypothetical protein KY310_04315, partial [Candidatus Woesearchaeota archaeon]|nr:hypothetical protein [Candidatus Woesearchaeota archaeon]